MAYALLYSDEQNSEPVANPVQHTLFQSKYMVQVPVDFIQDQFNHTDLQQFFSHYNEAFDQLLHALDANDQDLLQDVEPLILYGLLHKRFIYTDVGLSKLHKLVQAKVYGTCLRQGCFDQPLAPIGVSDKPGVAPFNVYCPRCNQVYQFYGENEVDGSFFGMELAHLLYMKYPPVIGPEEDEMRDYCGQKLFGFEIAWDKMPK